MAQLKDLLVAGPSRFIGDVYADQISAKNAFSDWLPSITNTYSLGSESLKWKNLYAQNGYLSNALSVDGNVNVGGQLSPNGGLYWTSNGALPEATSLSYFLGIDAFASGGRTKWISAANACASIVGTPTVTIGAGTASNAPTVSVKIGSNTGTSGQITKATTGLYGVTKLTNSYTSTDESLATTGKALLAAIQTLDVSAINGSASKTLTSISETDGKISATYSDISITTSQISDFPTSLTPTSHTHGNITNDGKIGSTADYAVYTTTGGTLTAGSLAVSDPSSTSGSTTTFISKVTQNSKGQISVEKKTLDTSGTWSGNAMSASSVAWSGVTSPPDTATRWPKWNEITQQGADSIDEGSSDFTDNTELFSSYASNNGFTDSNAKGKVYRRDAIKLYNYIKTKAGTSGSGFNIAGNAATSTQTKVTEAPVTITKDYILMSATAPTATATAHTLLSSKRMWVNSVDKGKFELVLGNETATTTAGGQYGQLALYSSGTKGTYLASAANSTKWYTATLQAADGTIAYTSDITTAIQALDVTEATNTAGKTINKISETDGKISVTFQNISITKSQISDFPTSLTPTSHAHGNITNDGKITAAITVASGDYLIIGDTSDGGKLGKGPAFVNTTAKQFLKDTGAWVQVDWGDLTGKPSTFTPSSHTHGNITNAGELSTATRAVVTDGNKKITVADLTVSSATAETTTATTFVYSVTQNAQGQITVKTRPLPTYNNYSLPLAANGTRGGIQIGYSSSGKNYAVQLSSEKAYVNVPWTDTKVNYSLNTTAKAYLMASTTTPTGTAAAVESIGDTGVYLTTTIGELSSLRYSWHDISATPVEKAYTAWNATDESIDFVFV